MIFNIDIPRIRKKQAQSIIIPGHSYTQQDKKRTAHSCSKVKSANEKRDITIAGHNYYLLEVRVTQVHKLLCHQSISIIVRSSIFLSKLCIVMQSTAECFPNKLLIFTQHRHILTLQTDLYKIRINLPHLLKFSGLEIISWLAPVKPIFARTQPISGRTNIHYVISL